METDYNKRRRELYQKNKEKICEQKRLLRRKRIDKALKYEKEYRLKQKNNKFICSNCKKEKTGKKVKNLCRNCYSKIAYLNLTEKQKEHKYKLHIIWCNKSRIKVRQSVNKSDRKRRAKLKKIKEIYTDEEWLAKLEKTKGICPSCKQYKGVYNLHLDHIYPISKAKEGQIYTINDVQPLCKSCNSKKGNKRRVKK